AKCGLCVGIGSFSDPLEIPGLYLLEHMIYMESKKYPQPCDENRKEQLFSSFARTNHPASKFTWGNLITLRDNVHNDKLYEELHKFRKRHYSVLRMKLTIRGPQKQIYDEIYKIRKNIFRFSDMEDNVDDLCINMHYYPPRDYIVNLHFVSDLGLQSPKNTALIEVYCSVLRLLSTEELYPSIEAEFHFDIRVNEKGIIIKMKLLMTIAKYMMDYPNLVMKDLFEIVHLYIQCLVQGNMTQDAVIKTTTLIAVCFNMILQTKVIQILLSTYYCKLKNINKIDVNFVTNYYQADVSSIELLVLIDLLIIIMKEPLSNRLRTQEQLGYVSCIFAFTQEELDDVKKVLRKFKKSRIEREALAMKNIKINDLREWFAKHTLNGSNCRKLSIHM
ncbi:Nardilysin, partial [Atta colombica]